MKHVVAFVGLGSNLGRPRRQIARAVAALAALPRTRLVAVSAMYRTAPLGCSDPQPDYLNAVAALRTTLAPRPLLARLLAIERRQRRKRGVGTGRNEARTLDLDLLLYGRQRIRLPHLVVPHPRMHERAFVLRPLAEIAPTILIPRRGVLRMIRRAVGDQRARPTGASRVVKTTARHMAHRR